MKEMKSQFNQLESIVLLLTHSCNLRCIHCTVNASSPYPNELTSQEIKEVLKDAKTIGLKKVRFSGGEPFLRKDLLFDMLKFCKKLNIEAGITTNGTLIDEKDTVKLKKLTKKVSVTVFSMNEKVHDFITKTPGSLKKTEGGIKILIKNGIIPTICTVPMKPNYKDISQLVYEAQKLGIKSIYPIHLSPSGRALKNWNNLLLSKAEREWLVAELKKASKKTDIEIGITFCEKEYFNLDLLKGKNPLCPALYRCHIGPAGNVVPCAPLLYNYFCIAGNIRKKKISEIWFNAPIFLMLRLLMKSPPEPCKSCKDFDSCKMGCRAQILFETNDLIGPYLRCLKK